MSICSVPIVDLCFACMHYGSVTSGQLLHACGAVKCFEVNSNLRGIEY